jgi:archaellum component FlaC
MSELQVIESVLERASARRRWQLCFQGSTRGLALGAILLLLALITYKSLPVPRWVVLAAGATAVCLAVAGGLHGAWRRHTLLETARWVDAEQKLKERLSTALEVAEGRGSEEWRQLLLADAAEHARTLNPQQFIPFTTPRITRWALLTLMLCAGLGFVPAYRSKAHYQKQAEAVVLKDVGKNLAELMRRELAQKPSTLPTTQKTMEQSAELGDRLAKQSLTRAEAMKELGQLTDQLARQDQENVRNPALKPLQRAAREPGNGASSSPESLQKQIDAMQKALGDAANKADKLDELSKSLENLKQQAANMASKDGQAGSPSREQLAQSLNDLARQAREAGASLESLDEAIKALAANNTDLFLKDLDTALQDLEKLRDMAKAMQQLQEQAAKLATNLPEQLEKGQGKAAVQRLEKMMEQLRQSELSKEDMQKLLDEIQKAIKPGSQYGEVGELLKKAAKKGEAGDKAGATADLAQAQKELEKLLDQMADADSLQSTLDALARAQMALSQCKGWGECQGRPGFKPGGKPGRGVGTWADDYGWVHYDPPQSPGWDNSDVERPDLDPRGNSPRLDDLNPNLKPEKVKGQLSPGGSMPSVTLKGVSIKGTSNVKFEEAAAAAQEEAQSALNQDRVPRAYQNAVRDYFDDLKR